MNLTDSRLPQSGCEKLELSFLNFFEQFRKIYIGEQVNNGICCGRFVLVRLFTG